MKRYIPFLIAFFAFAMEAYCRSDQQEIVYDQAEEARVSGNVEAAYQIWQQLAHQSPHASFNVGLYALLRGDAVGARAYLQYAAHNGDLFVRMASIACLEQMETITFFEKLWLLTLGLPRLVWALCALMLALLLLWCSHCIVRRRQQLLAQLMCFLFIVGCRGLYVQSGEKAVVLLHESILFAGPNDAFTNVGLCIPGQLCTIVSKKDGWCLVKTNYCSGWVQAEHVLG